MKRFKKLLKEFKAPEMELEITGIAFPKSWPVARAGEKDVWVPGAVVGDRVRARILRRNPAVAKITRLLEPSPLRTEAVCPHFGACGGRAFQNLNYPNRSRSRKAIFAGCWERRDRPGRRRFLSPFLPSPSLFGYRNKMEFAFAGAGGDLRLGLRERSLPRTKSRKRTVDLRTCPLFGPAADRLLPAARRSPKPTDGRASTRSPGKDSSGTSSSGRPRARAR